MKKFTVTLLVAAFLLTLAGCGKKATPAASSAAASAPAAQSAAASSAAASTDSAPTVKAAPIPSSDLDALSKTLGIDCSAGKVEQSSDTHDANGEGQTYYVVKFPDKKLDEAVSKNELWYKFPLTDTLIALVYGLTLEGDDVVAAEGAQAEATAATASTAVATPLSATTAAAPKAIATPLATEEAEEDDDFDLEFDPNDPGDDDDADANDDVVFEEDDGIETEPPVFDEEVDENEATADVPDDVDLDDPANAETDEDVDEDDYTIVETIGPYIMDEKENALIPQVKHGYYWFQDRHPDSIDPTNEEVVLDRESINFSVAIYDTDTQTLYFAALDTSKT